MEDIVLVGAGGHCASIIDSIKSTNEYNIIGIIDNTKNIGEIFYGIPVIGTDADANSIYEGRCQNIFIAVGSVGNQNIRKYIYRYYKNIGFKFPTIIDNSAVISQSLNVGQGTFVAKACTINIDVKIGDNCIINTGVIIDHNCNIGNHVHIATGTTLSGGITVDDESHIGTSSTIIQNITIGRQVVVGAGSVVVKNIKDNVVAFGNPCIVQKENIVNKI